MWSHLKTFTSDPGFIPMGYNYNINLMTPTNVSLFNVITLEKEREESIDSAKKKLALSDRPQIKALNKPNSFNERRDSKIVRVVMP